MKVRYFAYGCNMDADLLGGRPGQGGINVKHQGTRAKLVGYTLTFDKKSESGGLGRATIEKSPGSAVWGVLLELPCECLKILDGFEGVKSGHYRHERVKAFLPNGREVKTATHVALPERLEI